jgi:hypothetical protein
VEQTSEEIVSKPGRKSLRGIPESEWNELKSASLGVKLTPTGKFLLIEKFENISELLEKLARGFFKISPTKPSQLAEAIACELAAKEIKLHEFADLVHIPIDRLRAILDSQKATESELVWLQSALDKDIEELVEWNNAENIGGSHRSNRASCGSKSFSGVE